MADRQIGEGERRLAAIMFTDMVGYTALAQRDEALALRLLDEQRKVVRAILAGYQGREVETIGDAFFVEFTSARDAVQCAIAIQAALREGNAPRPPSDRIWIRIGIHLGDVVHRGREVAGDAVNVASRIEQLAPPGGICLTAQVQSSVVNKVEAQFESLGTLELKHVAAPVEVFRVAGMGESLGAVASPREGISANRLAVLPFTSIGPEDGEEYFADGITEELISEVSRIRELRVIARTSVMRYKGTAKPISEIGRELGVGSILEGSVRKAGDQIRISVQLVDTRHEEPRWSRTYDRRLQDIFAIQTEIAQAVASALREEARGSSVGERRRDTRNAEAYTAYLRGRQFWNKRTQDGLNRAIGFFEKALEIDGNFARALVGLADSYAILALLEFAAPHEAYPKAVQAVHKALSIDPSLAEAHTSSGLIKFQYEWDWAGAEREFCGALDLHPNYAPGHHFFADYLKAMGRFDEALAEIEKARELDPLSLAINTGVGHVLYLSRQYDKAIEEYQRAVDLDPNFMATHVWFGRPYLEKGMFAEAIAELEIAVRLSGESTLALAMLGHGLAAAGRRSEAEQILAKLQERSSSQYVPSYWIAVIHNGLRNREEVVRWMGKAFEERSSWLVWANVEPRFDWLRDDAGFVSLMAAMKFPSIDRGPSSAGAARHA